LRPSHTQSANGHAASHDLAPGRINYGAGDDVRIETGHMGYFDADDLRP
jgi:hypothetical protein